MTVLSTGTVKDNGCQTDEMVMTLLRKKNIEY
jgi:hypothetical protein